MVVLEERIIWAKTLPTGTSALTKALTLGKNKGLNVYTDALQWSSP